MGQLLYELIIVVLSSYYAATDRPLFGLFLLGLASFVYLGRVSQLLDKLNKTNNNISEGLKQIVVLRAMQSQFSKPYDMGDYYDKDEGDR
jgi:hypothetical protein